MDILTESELRAMCLKDDTLKLSVSPDTFVTPGAKEYLRDRGIALIFEEKQSGGMFGKGIMSYTAIPKSGERFLDYRTGEVYNEKPEHMTHLRSNLLVAKNDPRIAFRGKLDSLEALIMETQITAVGEGYKSIADDLDELMSFVQRILACEVKDEPFKELVLLGMDSEKIRYVSHNVSDEIGVQHSVPHYSMGKLCVKLNSLRTFVRETELAAANAFLSDSTVERPDLIEALNRLSSCVYIIFCKTAAGKYPKV